MPACPDSQLRLPCFIKRKTTKCAKFQLQHLCPTPAVSLAPSSSPHGSPPLFVTNTTKMTQFSEVSYSRMRYLQNLWLCSKIIQKIWKCAPALQPKKFWRTVNSPSLSCIPLRSDAFLIFGDLGSAFLLPQTRKRS